MFYSFDYAAHLTRLCMDEIRKRGLQERKILRKSVPNSTLYLKAFYHQVCSADDLALVNIHSVATLMQDVLWCCQERLVSKKIWRHINYETCALSNLSSAMTPKGEILLMEILDFLVELMRYKGDNLMSAHHLGEAMGKVTLGPADCDLILAEKAGHFMTRMIIEHSKLIYRRKTTPEMRRVDSGFDVQYYCEYKPMSKVEATTAKAKSYNRTIKRIRAHADWLDNAAGLRAMFDDDYEHTSSPVEHPWVPIFSDIDDDKLNESRLSPLLHRILTKATKPLPPIPRDPFKDSTLLDKNTNVDLALQGAFDEFRPHTEIPTKAPKTSPLKKLNRSLSNLKLNVYRLRSRHDMPKSESNFTEMTEETQLTESNRQSSDISRYGKSLFKKAMYKGGRLEPRSEFHSSVLV